MCIDVDFDQRFSTHDNRFCKEKTKNAPNETFYLFVRCSMTKFKEYRIPMPLTLDEYRLGQRWTENELIKEMFENCSTCLTIFDHRDENERAQMLKEKFSTNLPMKINATTTMTHKRYNVKDQIPKYVENFFFKTKNEIFLDEFSWEIWPFTFTIIENVDFHWRIVIRSYHENHHSTNLYETNRKILKNFYSIDDEQEKFLRDFEILNIAERLDGKDYRIDEDPTKSSSRKRTNLLPLEINSKWFENFPKTRSSMCVFKLIELVVLDEKSLVNKAMNKFLVRFSFSTFCRTRFFFSSFQWSTIVKTQKMIYQRFHQKLICNVDRWIDEVEENQSEKLFT